MKGRDGLIVQPLFHRGLPDNSVREDIIRIHFERLARFRNRLVIPTREVQNQGHAGVYLEAYRIQRLGPLDLADGFIKPSRPR